jgi:ElaB/YqjD/DUF883 family membrane-anchored ribosome-binding protein
MNSILNTPGGVARSQSDALGDRAAAGIDRVSSRAHDTVDRLASAAASTAHSLGERGTDLLMTQERWLESSRSYVRDHPIAAVGVAVAAGYLLSRLLPR